MAKYAKVWDGTQWQELAVVAPAGPTGNTGPQGPQGVTGPTGINFSNITTGVQGWGLDSAKPIASAALNGLIWYSTDTETIYKIVAGAWVSQAKTTVSKGVFQLNVRDFGAVGDYVYPGIGTNDTAAIQACFDLAKGLRDLIAGDAAKSSLRVSVLIPPGQYLVSNVQLWANISIEMSPGARLIGYPTIIDFTKPILLIGETGTQSINIRATNITISSDVYWHVNNRHAPSQKNVFACVEVRNVTNSHIDVAHTFGAYNGLLVTAKNGLFTAYNNFYLRNVGDSCKHGVTLLGGESIAWINENKFFGGNFTATSNLYPYGINSGIRFSRESETAYSGQNQNVFFGPCFQPAGVSASYNWSSGKTGLQKHYRYHSGGYTYIVTSTGDTQVAGTTAPHLLSTAAKTITGITKANPAVVTATAHGFSNGDVVYIRCAAGMTQLDDRPITVANVTADTFECQGIDSTSFTTFTAGTVFIDMTKPGCWRLDSNSVKWECEGHTRMVPVMHELGSGSTNAIYGARHEGGTGGFAYVMPRRQINNPQGNKAEIYSFSGDPSITGYSGSYSEDNLVDSNSGAWKPSWNISTYGSINKPIPAWPAKDLQYKVIKGATKWCFPGLFCTNMFAQTTYTRSKAGSHVLHEDGVKIVYSDFVSFDIDCSVHKRFAIRKNKHALAGSMYFQAIDSSGTIMTLDYAQALSVNGAAITNTTVYKTLHASTQTDLIVAAGPTTAFIRVHLSGSQVYKDVCVVPLDDYETNNKSLPIIRNVLGTSLDESRYTDGAPTVGYFLEEGELIRDISDTSVQYKVTTPGALAPAWASATTVYTNELRSNAGKIYSATSAASGGTATSTTAPTHSSGSVSDGAVTWKYVCAEAKLVALGGIGTAITGSTTLTAAQIAAAQMYPASGATTITIDTAFPDKHEMVFYKTDAANTITIAGSGLTPRGTATISTQYARVTVKRSGTDLLIW